MFPEDLTVDYLSETAPSYFAMEEYSGGVSLTKKPNISCYEDSTYDYDKCALVVSCITHY